MIDKLRVFAAKAKVVLEAVPTRAAAITALLTAVQTVVIPVLPGPWAVQAGVWCASALGIVAAIVKAVARVTPVPKAERGLLPPA